MPDRHGTVLKGTTYRYTNVNSCTKLHTLFILSKIVVCESLAVATNPIPHPYSYLLLWDTLRIFYFNPTLPWLMIFLKPILECYMYLNQIIANGAGICQNIIKCYLQYFHIHRPSLYDKKNLMMHIYGDNLFITFHFDRNHVCYFEEEKKWFCVVPK